MADNLDDLLVGGGGFQNPGNSITWPFGAGFGQSRIVAGADTPPELLAYGVDQAILFYVTQPVSNDELGYYWIGNGDTLTDSHLWIGTVRYPVPDDPSSATVADVNQVLDLALFNIFIEPLRQDELRLAIDTATIESGQPFLSGQTGVELMNSAGVAVTFVSVAVVFTIPFNTVPSVHPNVNSGSGTWARWDARAINISTTGFTMFFYRGSGADPAAIVTNVEIVWTAVTAGQ